LELALGIRTMATTIIVRATPTIPATIRTTTAHRDTIPARDMDLPPTTQTRGATVPPATTQLKAITIIPLAVIRPRTFWVAKEADTADMVATEVMEVLGNTQAIGSGIIRVSGIVDMATTMIQIVWACPSREIVPMVRVPIVAITNDVLFVSVVMAFLLPLLASSLLTNNKILNHMSSATNLMCKLSL